MKLSELLKTQEKLNQHCPRYPSREELSWALLAELGEFAQSRKGDWCWWNRDGVPFVSEPRDRQLAEIADILCFIFVAILIEGDAGEDFERLDRRYEAAWDVVDIFSDWSVARLLNACQQSIENRDPVMGLVEFVRAIARLGYGRGEVEEAYNQKVEVNKERWKAKHSALTEKL
jgi:hypothetical protein